MVEDERYCPEVLVQIRSASAALDQIGYLLLRDHLAHRVADGVRAGEGDAYLEEVMEVIRATAAVDLSQGAPGDQRRRLGSIAGMRSRSRVTPDAGADVAAGGLFVGCSGPCPADGLY